jgi:hydroxymethylbilane synthase
MRNEFIIGSRGSDLALWQANFVRSSLEQLFPENTFTIKIIKTTGDEQLEVALSKIGDKGLFTRQIENELLRGEIDIAVHSLKDLQTVQPDGLIIGAVCERELPNDVFISKHAATIDDLEHGAKIATGSLRRKSQLLNHRPDLNVAEIRGNVPTRIRKFNESGLDGMILAFAGLHRLGLDAAVSQIIPFDLMLPAVGQGAVAVEMRSDDKDIAELAVALDHKATRKCVTAERSFLRRLEGGCQVPIGAIATFAEEGVRLEGMVGSLDGKIKFRDHLISSADDAEELGVKLAELLIAKGANDLLEENRRQADTSPEAVI